MGRECIEMDLFSAGQLVQSPPRLRRAIDDFGPDLIHAHGSRAGFLVAMAKPKAPLVYTVHGLHLLHRPFPLRALGAAAERLTSRRASLTIFVSHMDRDEALSHRLVQDENRAVVIHNGIRPPAGSPAPAVRTDHLGFVGRLETPKDPLLFLRVVERLPGFDATMVGWGALGPAVEEEIARRSLTGVKMLGEMSHEETLDAMAHFGVLVVTSRWEAFGLAALEAMALGVPVVAPRVGGLGEIIEDNRSGILVQSRSADGLADAVRRLSEDLRLRQQVIEGGRARVREHFSEEHMLGAMEDAYERVFVAKAGRSSIGHK